MSGAERKNIPLAKPWLGESEAAAVCAALASGWITQGPRVAAFEREFAAHLGAPHACAVSSCTTALHLALLAAGVQPDDEVITASHSFIATANSVRYCGAIPVFVDIEPGTFNMRPELVEQAITPRTRAILCVHQMGMPCEVAAMVEIGNRRGLRVIEDAACAIGSQIRPGAGAAWEHIGKPIGDVACFSFHPRKVLTTGDGGMLTTAHADWDAQFRLWRQHGMSVPDAVRHGNPKVIFESYDCLGYNYRMTDLQAAIGLEQLKRLDTLISRRRILAARYHQILDGLPGVTRPYEPAWARSNWQSYCVGLDKDLDQRTVMQHMLDEGIATRRGIMCTHTEPAYRNEPWSCGSGPGPCECPESSCKKLSASEHAHRYSIVLPLYHEMTDADQDRVVTELAQACRKAREVAR